MTITPNDISNKEFKKVFRGYDADEVDEFLEEIVENYEKIYKDNVTLKENISNLEEKISHYSNIELTLQNTLLLAQSAADQAKENSKRESELIIKQSQEQSRDIIHNAEQRVLDINKEFEILKKEYDMFKTRFKGLLEAQIGSLEKPFTDEKKWYKRLFQDM